MLRIAVLLQLLFILGCVAYSTYALFKGDFQQAFIPYPILIIYYLIFARRKMTERGSGAEEGAEDHDS